MNTADMMIHMQPELDAPTRRDLERCLQGRIGVDCAEFEHRQHPHSVLVRYDPDAVKGVELLQMARSYDPAASIVGM